MNISGQIQDRYGDGHRQYINLWTDQQPVHHGGGMGIIGGIISVFFAGLLALVCSLFLALPALACGLLFVLPKRVVLTLAAAGLAVWLMVSFPPKVQTTPTDNAPRAELVQSTPTPALPHDRRAIRALDQYWKERELALRPRL
jgi:membrane protein implicated in regulation of membrane protease activity